MARLKKGDRVSRVGGEETVTPSGMAEPVYGLIRDVRAYIGDGAVDLCLVKFDDDGHQEWLRWTDLEEVCDARPNRSSLARGGYVIWMIWESSRVRFASDRWAPSTG